MSFNVNETLLRGDLPADVLPHLIWNEILAGVVKRRVFLEACEISEMLIGAVGTKVSVPYVSAGFTATTITESALDSTGYTVTSPTILDTDINIGNQVYVAFRISDILKEDQPKYDFFALLLRDAGRAIAEYEDTAIRNTLLAGPGNTISSATAGTLAYEDLLTIMDYEKTDSWYPDGDYLPFLFIHPDQEMDLLKDSRYVNSHRYAVGDLGKVAGSEDAVPQDDVYVNCRVRVTENMVTYAALLVFPTHPVYGPVVIHAYKRPLTIKNQREELYGRQLWAASLRYGTSIIQANGVGLISNC